MAKKLSEMTLNELWELFPIVLSEHKDYWSEQYREEVSKLKSILPEDTEYHHVGSTAVFGIMAKPIVDILIVVGSVEKMANAATAMKSHGYIIMSESHTRVSLNYGYTESGFAEKVFHYHIRLKGDTDEIYFRDYLIAHPDIAHEYEKLKLKLWKEYEHNRDAYTNAKSDFVKKYTDIAKNKQSQSPT